MIRVGILCENYQIIEFFYININLKLKENATSKKKTLYYQKR
jgi:hypothetical protein